MSPARTTLAVLWLARLSGQGPSHGGGEREGRTGKAGVVGAVQTARLCNTAGRSAEGRRQRFRATAAQQLADNSALDAMSLDGLFASPVRLLLVRSSSTSASLRLNRSGREPDLRATGKGGAIASFWLLQCCSAAGGPASMRGQPAAGGDLLRGATGFLRHTATCLLRTACHAKRAQQAQQAQRSRLTGGWSLCTALAAPGQRPGRAARCPSGCSAVVQPAGGAGGHQGMPDKTACSWTQRWASSTRPPQAGAAPHVRTPQRCRQACSHGRLETG